MVSKADVDDLKEIACIYLAFVCEFLCVYIGVRGELPDVVWANCLVETKTQELPLTAELNQNPGNLFMKHRKTARKHDFLSLLKNATYGKAHTLTIEIHFNCFCCSCDLSWFVLG